MDINDLLQRMMQSNMQPPRMQAPSSIPGMQYANGNGVGSSGASGASSGPSLFDLIQKFKSGGGNSLFAPQTIDDQTLSGPASMNGPTSDNGNPLFQGNRMQAVALQRPASMGSGKGGAVG